MDKLQELEINKETILSPEEASEYVNCGYVLRNLDKTKATKGDKDKRRYFVIGVWEKRKRQVSHKLISPSVLFFFLFLFLLVSAVGVLGAECGTTPTENCTVSVTTTFTTGTYYLNDSDGGSNNNDGAIIINGTNLFLDCSGATIQGNQTTQSTGIEILGNKPNVTVKNCRLDSFTWGIFWNEDVDNLTALNNTLSHIHRTAITGVGSQDGNVTSNKILGNITTTNAYGIQFIRQSWTQADENNWIYDNFINGTYFGIYLTRSKGNTILENRINNTVFYGINLANSNTTIVKNNTIYNAGHNGIDIGGFYNNISWNYIKNPIHNGIDLFESNTANDGCCNEIFKNTITGEATIVGIYISDSYKNNVYGNIIQNLTNSTASSTIMGIQLGGNNSNCYANTIYDNIVENIAEYCLWDALIDNIWRDNTLNLCGLASIRLNRFDEDVTQNKNSTFNYNIISDTVPQIEIHDSQIWAYFRFPTNPSTVYLFNVTSTTSGANLTIFSSNISTHVIYNKTDKSFYPENILSTQSEVNITLSANQEIYVIDRPTFKESNNFLSDSADNNIEGCVNITGTTTKSLRSCISTPFNAEVTLDNPLTCNDLASITFTPDSGSSTQTFTAGTDFTCGSTITINVVGIELAASSNTFVFNDIVSAALQEIPEGLDAFAGFFVIMAVILAAVVILIFIGILRGESGVLNLISQDNIIKFIAVILAIVFLVVIGLIVLAELAG